MKYTVHGKQFEYNDLQQYLIRYCLEHSRRNHFYLSRKFYNIEGENGEFYTASVVFDKNDKFVGYYFKKSGKKQPQTYRPIYELTFRPSLKEFEKTEEFESRQDLIAFLEKSDKILYKLTDYKTGKTFGVKYFPERQELEVNRKPYSINVFKS